MSDTSALTLAYLRAHPQEAARVLESADTPASVELLARIPARVGGPVLAQMLPRAATLLLRSMPEERAFELLAHIDAQRTVAILRHSDAEQQARLLAGLPTTTAITARMLLEYPADSVGACMNPDIIVLGAGVRVEAALDSVRASPSDHGRIYLVDDARRLLGWTPLGALLRAPGTALLDTLRLAAPAHLSARAPLSGARAHPGWQAASVLPVVDRQDRLLGELTHDALDRAAQRLRPARPAEPSLAAALALGYWQGLSGILKLLTPLLPASRPIGTRRHEH